MTEDLPTDPPTKRAMLDERAIAMADFEPFYPHNPRWIPREDSKLRLMIEQGVELEEIVNRLNRPISGIQRRCRQLGLPVPILPDL